ncbi:hypothetical protein GQ457_13G027810 [Hibiscus cannabinus]
MEICQMFDEAIQDRFEGSIDVVIINCVDFSHYLVIAAEVNASDLIREVTTEFGVDFDADVVTIVIDHTGYVVSEIEGGHTLIVFDNFIKYDVILRNKKIIAHVLFQGIGHSLKYGSTMSLVLVVQVRNNAQILVYGSLRMFNNRFELGFNDKFSLMEKMEISYKELSISPLMWLIDVRTN